MNGFRPSRRSALELLGAATLGAGGVGMASGTAHAAQTASAADPDELFRRGRFKEAERGYRELLRANPDDQHANAQVGYIALLSNRFQDAETHLTKATELAPDDRFSLTQLADTFVRQDQLGRAAPILERAGNKGYATQLASVSGTPYQVNGAQSTRIPFRGLDPLPLVEASVSGRGPRRFLLDTGGTLSLSMETAEEAGLEYVATGRGRAGGQTFTMYFGVLDSFRMGDVELRNIPVHWHDAKMPAALGDPQPSGVIGTTIFYHFLTTMDYAGRALVLRQKNGENLREFQAEARRSGAEKLPLWLAFDHFPCTVGSLNHLGPGMVSLDTGGSGGIGVVTTEEMARRAGIRVDRDRATSFNRIPVYPCVPDRASLGKAVARDIYSIAGPLLMDDRFRFETIANFTHAFFKPYAITFDFTEMNFYIAGKPSN
ncbi:aspartyl protease family protein [Nonomuraea endophytica]|uniref:aspartyl protease family protein n=1 Tax=Nonomuraea endophytica TaxID=714136 RepID=UPI0037C9E002